ncbi:D-glycero-beta-D-manno-heptose 1-phosphate adenylyltransferase [soil metagenome]
MTRQKILSREELLTWREVQRQDGHRVVWTNGCFDLLHPGHVASLEAARELGQKLVVGINSDASVRANKGPTRPIMTEYDRAKMLAAMECVDAVTIFDEETPETILMVLKPEVHCKGAEYAPGNGRKVPEADIVAAYGGTIVYLPLVPGISTTTILERLRQAA